jgi:Flp pilus assembly protein TadD
MMELQFGPSIKPEVMAIRRSGKKYARLFSVVSVSMAITACAAYSPQVTDIPPLENQPLLEIEDVNLLGVSAPMKRFVRNYSPEDMIAKRKAWNLAYAALDSVLWKFDYDPSVTLTASETFNQQTGNCLSFSNMFIAMAREAGLKAWFQEVKLPPEWSSVNQTLLVSMHVNAVVEMGHSQLIVDVSGAKRNEWTRSRRLSDAEAMAQYYNNHGADALIENDLAKAFAYFVKAIGVMPETSYIWSNLGVVFNRNGQTDAAKQAYFTALEIDSSETVALNNLHTIYMEEGDLESADIVSARVERHRRQNPYYLHHLSSQALDERRYEDAIELLKRAIKLNGREYRFHFTLARSLLLNGEQDAARRSLGQAKQLAHPHVDLDTLNLHELEDLSDI